MVNFKYEWTAAFSLLLALSAAPAAADAVEDACALSAGEEQTLLALDYRAFDQAAEPSGGWRKLGADKCYLAAAGLIDKYLALEDPNLTQQNIRILNWHAGQLSADAGLNDRALSYFRMAFRPEDDPSSWLDWNSYVAGSIAFLEHDRAALVAARDRLRLQEPFQREDLKSLPTETAKAMRGKKPNLDVLDAFLNCFDRPYVEAYGAACRTATPLLR